MQNSKKKLLYVMGIDWDWIFQRPQILEQYLEKDFDITVIFPRSIVHWNKQYQSTYPKDFRILWTIPFQEKNKLIGWFAELFHRKLFRDYQSFDYIYLGYPLYIRYLPKDYEGVLIYDCMDHFEKLYPDQKRAYRIADSELQVLNRAQLIVTSSFTLLQKIKCSFLGSTALIRNGVTVRQIAPVKAICKKSEYQLGYFGTIAEWFDYKLLQTSLQHNLPVTYHLIGPVAAPFDKSIKKILFHGTVKHNLLAEYIAEYDCLIMPFQTNDLVQAVDPVKLYEYIAFGKCIISVYYEEIKHFDEFVYFYHSQEEYLKLLNKLCQEGFPAKYTKQQQKKFLLENQWSKRYQTLQCAIDTINKKNGVKK